MCAGGSGMRVRSPWRRRRRRGGAHKVGGDEEAAAKWRVKYLVLAI